MRSNGWILLLILAANVRAETPVTLDLNTLSAEAKQELLKKKERFEHLSPEEQSRLRKFHSELTASPDAPKLEHTLTHYHEWLRTLKPLERDELLSLPADERIAQIRKLMQEQEKLRFREMAKNVPAEDLEVIVKWLEDTAASHKDRLVESMPPEVRERWEAVEDAGRKRWMLVWAMRMRPPGPNGSLPAPEDFAKLVRQLSPQSQEQLKKTPQSGELIKEWIQAAMASKLKAQVSNEKLSEFFRDLRADEREKLERLSSDERRSALMRMYLANQARRDGFRPWGPPGEGRGPGNFVRPDGSRPGSPGERHGEDEHRRPFRGRPEGPRPDGPRPPEGPKPPEKVPNS